MVKKRWGMITGAAVGVILLTTAVSAFMGEEIEKSALINVAVTLAKKYLDEKDYKFINAVLDKAL